MQETFRVSVKFGQDDLEDLKKQLLFPMLDCLGQIISILNKVKFEKKEHFFSEKKELLNSIVSRMKRRDTIPHLSTELNYYID